MKESYRLVTNNDRYAAFQAPGCLVELLDDKAENVLIRARDLIHQGWRLKNGPLYGNFRPYHQPFRTLLLQAGSGTGFDEYGLQLIEGAIAMYQGCQWPHVTPHNCAPEFLEDYKTIDSELMIETLRDARLVAR